MASVADTRAQGVGFSGGVAFDPTQAFAGVLFESQPLVDRFHVRPGIDGAFGNDLQLAIIDVLFMYKFSAGPLSPWEVYQGTGPVVTIERAHGQRAAHGGIGAVFGAAHRSGFFFEF